MKRIITLLVFLISGLTFAQTTVNLEDQCNCEVLSGTDVTAPGLPTPAGADIGDIYVNTDTGTIYFWDGDSWELTSSDDQQLQNFTFDNVSGELSLTLENGGTATVILPVETITTLTGTAALGNAIGVYENENGDLVTINETITTISDAGDGNITLTNESGATVTVAKSDITDLGGGVYQFTNGDGTDVTIDTNGMTIDNVILGNRIATVNEADGSTTDINETITNITGTSTSGNEIGVYEKEDGTTVSIQESIVRIEDNNDGNITLVDEAGNSVTVAKSDITDLGGGVYRFTNGDGTDVDINTNGIAITDVVAGNLIATVTQADGTFTEIDETITNITGTSTSGNEIGVYEKEDGTTVSIQESIVRIEDNNDGNITLVDEAGNSVTVAKSDITDLGGGVYRFTNGDGTDVDINTNGIAITDVVAGNLIATVTQADGTFTEIDETITNISGTSTSGNEIGVYEKEDGTTVSIQESIVRIEDNNDGNITLVDEAGNSVTVAKSDITDLGGGVYRFTNGDGTDVDINTNGIAITDVVAGNLIATVTQADGTFTEIDETITNISGTSTSGNEIGVYEKEDGTTVSIQESIVRIEDNNDGNITLVDEAGNSVTVAKSDITDLGGGVYRFTNGDGTDVDINTNGIAITDVVAGNLIATVTQADGTFTEIDETITNISGTSTSGNEIGVYEKEDGTTVSIQESIVRIEDNNDGNITLVDEAGNSVTVAKSDITDLGGGLYRFTNGDGTDVDINTNGIAITDVVAGNLIATVTQADGTFTEIDETITNITGTSTSGNEIGVYEKEDGTTVSIQESIVRIEDNNDGNITLVDEAGNSVTVAKSDITDLGGGLYRFTNGDGTDVDINTNGIAITDVVAGNLIATVTQADGTFTEIDETITTLSTADSVNYTYTSENGTPTSFDGTDDQEATEVNLTTPLDVDGDSVDETTVEEAIIDLAANASDNQNLTGATLSGTNQLQIDIERGSSTSVDLSSLVETVIAGTGAISVADDGNGNYTVTSTDPDEDETNELTLIDSGAPVVIPSNSGVTYVDDVAGQLYVFDGTTWQQVGGSAAPDADPDPNNELQTLTSTDGSVTLTPSGNDYDLSVAVVDGTETKVESGNANVTVTGDGSTATPYQISSVDLDEQNATEVPLDAPFDVDGDTVNETTVQEALEDLAANASDNQQVSSAVGTPNETVAIDLERGGSTTINIQDADADATNEIQDATEVALNTPFDVDGDTVNETTVQEALEDLAANASDNQQVSSAVGTPNETVDIDLERGGSTTINIQDADADATNEIQDATEVALNTPFDVDGDTVNETTVQEALEDLAANASDDQTLSTDGNPGNISISEGNAISLNVDDADANASNEIQTLTSTDGSVTLTPSGNDYDLSVAVVDGTETKVESGNANVTVTGDGSIASPYQISSVDLDEQNATEVLLDAPFDVDGDTVNETTVQEALEDLAANASDNQQISSTVTSPNELVNVALERGSNFDIDIRDADSDVTNELTLLGNGSPTVTPSNSGVTYVDEVAGQLYVYDGTTWNAVGGNASPDLDGNPNNEIQTVASADGSVDVVRTGDDFDLSITIPANNDNDATNEFQDLSLTGDNLTLSDDPTATTIDLSPYANNDTNEIQTVASADGSVDVVRTGDDFDLSITIPANNDNDATNEFQDLSLTGDNLTLSDDPTATAIDLSPYANNDTNEIQTVASADGSVDVVRTGDDFDLSITIPANNDNDATNEIQTVASADGSVDVVRTGDDFDLSITIPTNNDNDATNEIQDLGIAGDQLSITGGNTITLPSADGSETVVNGAGINAVTGSGTTASPYVVTGTEVDGDITNELTFVDAGTPAATGTTGTNSGETYVDTLTGQLYVYDGSTWQQVGGNASPDADPDPNNEIQTVASADGSVDVVRTGDDFDLSITIPTNNDNDATNEFQDLSLTGDNLTLSDDPTATAIDLSPYANNDTNEIQTVASADGSVDVVRTGDDFDLSITIPANNDNDVTNEIQDLGIAGDQLSITGGNTVTIPTADGSETIVNGAGINTVTGSGTTGSPYVVTGTEVDGDVTNEIQTVASADGSVDVVRTGDDFDLSITIPANNDNDATNEFQDLSLTGDNLTLSDDPTATAIDLSPYANNDTNEIQTVASADGSVDVVRTGDDFDLSITIPTNNDNDATNEFQDLSLTGDNLTLSDDPTATAIDLSPYANNDTNEIQTVASADGSVDVVRTGDDFDLSITIPANNDNDATNEFQDLSLTGDNLTLSDDPTATAIDLSPYANNDTNEIQTVASADGSVDVVRTGDDFDLSITVPANNDNDATNEIQTVASSDGSVDVVRTGDDFDLSITIPANNDNDATNEIQDLGIAGDQLSITGGNTITLPSADGSETVVNGAGINTVTGSGTTASPYVVTGTEVDGDITNELTFVDAGTPAATGTTGTNSGETYVDTLTGQLYVYDGSTWRQVGGNASPDADPDPNNEIQTITSTDGSVTLTQTGDDYNLSVAAADGTETKVESGNANITVTGDGSTTSPYQISSVDNVDDADADATNEIQDLGIVGDQLSITGGNTVTIPTADGTETKVESGNANVTVTGDGSTGSPYQISSVDNVDDADADATNEIQDLGIVGDQLSITGGNTVTIPTADGSETIVNGAGINTVTGSGTTTSPYVVTGTEVDGDITNEIQTVASADGSIDVVRTGDDFDLSITIPTNNDNDATNEIQDLGIAGDQLSITGGNTVTIPTADGSETIVNGAGINSVTGSGTTASPYVVTGTEVDGDITNEIQTVASADGSVDVVRTGDDFDLSITIPTNNDNDATNEIQDLGIAGDQLSITGGNTVTIPTADGSETIVNGAGINAVTGSGTTASPYVVTGTEVDGDITNEIQTVASSDGSVDVVRTGDDFDLSITIPTNNDNDATNEFQDLSLTGDNLTLSDDPTATAIDLSPYANNDTNEIQTVASADGSVDVVRTGDDFDLSITIPANNDNDITNEIQDLGIAGDQLSITGGNTITLPSADGSETVVNGAGINAVTGSGTTASPYVVTGTEVDGDITNEIQTVASADGSVDVVRTGDDFDLSITIPANNDNDATNEFQDLSLTGDNLTLSDDPTATAIDLSPYANNDTNEIQTVASADGSVDVVRTGDDFDLSITIPANNDNDATNEFQDLSLTGDNLNLSDDPTATAIDLSPYANNDTNEIQTVASADGSVDVVRTGDDFDLSVAAADGSETIVNGAGINAVTGSGTTASPYVVTGTEVDGDITNEIQTLTSTDGSVTLTETNDDYNLSVNFPASSDNQNIENLAINTSSNVLTVGIEDGSSQTVNLSHLDNSGTDNQSIRNLTFSGNTLTVGIEDGSSDTVSLAALADNQSIQGSGLSGTTLTIGIEDGSSQTVNLSSLANTDNQQISLAGNIITLDNGTGANTTVDLTDFRDDQNLTSAVVVPNQSVEVQINDGTNTTIDIRDADSDATNELQDLELTGSTLTLTNPATSGNSVDLSGLADHDWYEVGGTSAPDAITDNIFTEGNVGIGTTTITNNRALDVEGNVEINDYLYMNGKNTLRATDDNYLRINWSNDYVLGTFFNGNVRMYDGLVVNERGANSDMRVEGDTETFLLFTDASSDEVGIGTSSPDARLDVEGGTVRFSDYGSNAITGTPTSLLGVEADGDLVEVNSLKASKIFYPPSIEVDASTNGTGRTIDLHAQYVAQYGSPMVASVSAPAAIPTYANTELYYYVTFYDTAVFANVNVNAAGVMTYDVIGQPASYNSLINVVFVVK